jgi:hypothetical protein
MSGIKNKIQDVRNHIVAMMEDLSDAKCPPETIQRAKAISDLAQAYTNTIKVQIDGLRVAGREADIPEVIDAAQLRPLRTLQAQS